MTKNEIDIVKRCIGVTVPQHITAATWQDLRDLRAQLREGSKTLLDKAEANKRDLTTEERQASDAALAVLQTVQDEIENRLSDGRQGPRIIDEPMRPPISNQRGGKMDKIFAPRTTWRSIFGREPKAAEGIRNFGECLKALHHGDVGQLAELRTMANSTGELGGFSVDEPTWAQIWDGAYETSVTMDRLRYFPMSSNTLLIPAWDSEDQSKGKVGNVTGAWVGEGIEASRVTPRLRLIKYEAKKAGIFIACTAEVLQDSVALSSSLLPLMRNNLTSLIDTSVLTGSGVGEPQGILNSNAAISVSRNSAGTITFDDLAAMMGRMLPSSIRSCVWICSPSVFAVLVGLQVGTASGVLAMNNQTGATDFKMQILGGEVRVSSSLPERGTRGDLILADLGYYGFGSRETGRFEKTASAQWLSDVLDFRLIVRCDGHSLLDAPVTPANGTTTSSPFVLLDA